MLVAKQLADLITLSRMLLAFGLAWLGITHGPASLPLAAWLMIANWTGDCLDGPIARRTKVYYHSPKPCTAPFVLAFPRPALIGGDFNAHEHSPQIMRTQQTWLDTFRHLHPEKDGTTHELRWPWGSLLRRRRLDYIFLHSGDQLWNVLETRHVDAPGGPHSDHRAVLTRLAPRPLFSWD